MKVLIIISCFFVPFFATAQNVDSLHRDTAKKFIIVDAKLIDSGARPLYVVDGIIYKGNIKRIAPSFISAYVLGQPGATNIYGKQGANGAVLIMTKKFAVAAYQKKLGFFSKEYEELMINKRNDDTGFLYVINGVPLDDTNQISNIKALYELSTSNIKSVICLKQYIEGMDSKKPIVAITTKQ